MPDPKSAGPQERRLFYVAMTRARESLMISGRRRTLSPDLSLRRSSIRALSRPNSESAEPGLLDPFERWAVGARSAQSEPRPALTLRKACRIRGMCIFGTFCNKPFVLYIHSTKRMLKQNGTLSGERPSCLLGEVDRRHERKRLSKRALGLSSNKDSRLLILAKHLSAIGRTDASCEPGNVPEDESLASRITYRPSHY
ncbi:hypothetical protein AB6804_25415 [Caballeronia sp. RCC_10]